MLRPSARVLDPLESPQRRRTLDRAWERGRDELAAHPIPPSRCRRALDDHLCPLLVHALACRRHHHAYHCDRDCARRDRRVLGRCGLGDCREEQHRFVVFWCEFQRAVWKCGMDDFGGDDLDVGRGGDIIRESVLLLWSATVRFPAVDSGIGADIDIADDIDEYRRRRRSFWR